MNDFWYHFLDIAISAIALFAAFYSIFAAKSQKSSDLEKDIAMLKDADLSNRISKIERDVGVLRERLDNSILVISKIDNKLDHILENIKKDCE